MSSCCCSVVTIGGQSGGGGDVDLCNALPSGIVAGSAGGSGVAADAARCDHSHPVAVASPVATGTANAPGAAATLVRSDHVHETALGARDEAAPLGSGHTMDFVGAGVVAAVAAGVITVTIPGGGVAATTSLGGMACDNTAATVATVIPGVGAFVPVGTGAPGHPVYVLDAFAPGFAISGGAPTSGQTLDYAAVAAQRIVITPTVNVSTGVLGGIVVGMRVLQNGAPIGPVLKGQTAGLFFSSVTVTGEIHTTVAPGDTFQIEVANFTNGTSVVVEYAQISIEGTVG